MLNFDIERYFKCWQSQDMTIWDPEYSAHWPRKLITRFYIDIDDETGEVVVNFEYFLAHLFTPQNEDCLFVYLKVR